MIYTFDTIDRIENWLMGHRQLRVALLFAARMSNPALTSLFSILGTRMLALEDQGVYGHNLAIMFVGQAILEVGLTNSLVRFLSPAIQNKDSIQVHAILRASLQLKFYAMLLVGSLLLIYVMLGFYSAELSSRVPAYLLPAESPTQLFIVWLVFIGSFGLSLVTYLDSILVAHESFFRILVWFPGAGIIRLILLGLFAYQTNLTAEHLLFAFCAGPFLSVLLYFLVFPVRIFTAQVGRVVWKPWIIRLLRYNAWILLAAFMAIIAERMEMLIIYRKADQGIYFTAAQLMQAFIILLATMSSVLLPRLSTLKARTEFKQYFVKLYRNLLPAVVLFLPGLLVFPWLIEFIWGQDNLAAIPIFYILYPGFILRVYFAPLGIALFALDQPRIIAMEAGLRLLFGIVLVYIGYSEFGIRGAAWAALLSQFAGWIFLLYCYWSYFTRGNFPFQKTERPI